MSSQTIKMPVVMPRQTMRGHIDWVNGVVHLPGGRRVITSSRDGSLRLWDLKSGAKIGEDWIDAEEAAMWPIALSPNGNTVASGSSDGKVRLWDVKTGKVIAKWTGHALWGIKSVGWSADGERVLSGSENGTTRVWDIKSGEIVVTIKTKHDWLDAAIYSPDSSKIATCGGLDTGIKIWDIKTGKLLATLGHDRMVWSLAWTSDEKKLISGSSGGSIRIFDTATWTQTALLKGRTDYVRALGHTDCVRALSLSQNDRLLASASWDATARLWNLDTNLPIGPPFRHEDKVECVAFSADGGVLVTGCQDENAYAWDIHAILKEAGLEDLLPITNTPKDALASSNGALASRTKRIPPSSPDIDDMSFLEADATRCPHQPGDVDDELPPEFFDNMQADVHTSATPGAHSPASAFFEHFSSLLHRSRPGNVEATELPQPRSPSRSQLLGCLSSLIHRSRPDGDEVNERQQPPTPSRLRPHELLGRMSSLFPRSRLNTNKATEPQRPSTPSSSRSDAFIARLSSLFRSPSDTHEEAKLLRHSRQTTRTRYVVEVAAMRDKRALVVVRRPERPSDKAKRIKNPKWWVRIVLFLVCVSPGTDGGHPST